MRTLTGSEIELVGGAVDQSTQISFQSGVAALGVGLAAAGFALSPIGAFLLIGTSVAVTISYIADR
jgi:hypothetical protein